jgi:nitrogen fixation NifU-like protein
MELYIKVNGGVIVDAKFKTFGCGAAIATSSMVTELVKGKSVEEALKISNRAVAEALGGLPPIKMHCSVLAEEALKSAIDDYLNNAKKEVAND